MQEATLVALARFLREHIFTQLGVPEIILTDNGRQFVSKEFQKMEKQLMVNKLIEWLDS